MASFNMKYMVIAAIALLTLSVVTLMGTAVTHQMSKGVRDAGTIVALTDFNMSYLGTAASLAAYPYPQAATSCTYANDSTLSLTEDTDFQINEGTDYNNGEFVILVGSGEINGSLVNCTLEYLGDSDAQGAADLFTTALVVFGSFCGIIALSMVGFSIIQLFRKEE